MAKKDETPAHVKKFVDLDKKAKKITQATSLYHSDAYISAAKKHLVHADGQSIEYDKLDDAKVQDAFVKELVGEYKEAAFRHFGIDKKKGKEYDALRADPILQAYMGTTEEEIGRLVRRFGKDYTIETHEKVRDDFVKKIKEQLDASASGHLSDKHVDDLVKYIGSQGADVKFLDSSKMRLGEGLKAYEIFDSQGSLSKKMYERVSPAGKSAIYYKDDKKAA
ncbi:MAG: hypothetical protein ACMXYE_02405 [Candidatus Woesearchaeota archaeon]